MIHLINLLIIFGVTLLVYARAINYGYIIDDIDISFFRLRVTFSNGEIRLYTFNPKATDVEIDKQIADTAKNLTVTSKVIESGQRITGNKWIDLYRQYKGRCYFNPKVEHLMNITIHLIVSCLIYFAFGMGNIGLLTALLFALNPVNNQVSLWLSGRAYGVATALVLLGFILLPTLPLLYGLALLTTSVSVLPLPLLFLFKTPHWYLLLLIVGYIIVKNKHKVVIKQRYDWGSKAMVKLNFNKLIVFFKTLGYYFILCLIPNHIGMFHSYLHTYGMSDDETNIWHKLDIYFFIGIGLMYLTITNLLFNFNPIAFGLFWFILFTAQWCNLLVLNHPVCERYIYLANCGLMFALANIVLNTPYAYIFLTFYAVRLFYFMPAYKDLISYWKSNIDNFPTTALGYNQLGIAYANYGNMGSALDTFIQGVQYRPDDFRLNYNIANILIISGNLGNAVPFLKKAEATINPKINYEFFKGELDKMRDSLVKANIPL